MSDTNKPSTVADLIRYVFPITAIADIVITAIGDAANAQADISDADFETIRQHRLTAMDAARAADKGNE